MTDGSRPGKGTRLVIGDKLEHYSVSWDQFCFSPGVAIRRADARRAMWGIGQARLEGGRPLGGNPKGRALIPPIPARRGSAVCPEAPFAPVLDLVAKSLRQNGSIWL